MLSVIYGTDVNQDGIYCEPDDMFEILIKDVKTYQIFKDNNLVYVRKI